MSATATPPLGAASFCPSLCPLCGQPNGCVMAAGQPIGTPCWCADASFAPELLARVPPALRHKACICASCAARAALAEKKEQPSPPP